MKGKSYHRILKIRPVSRDPSTSTEDLVKTYQELESSDEVTNFLALFFYKILGSRIAPWQI